MVVLKALLGKLRSDQWWRIAKFGLVGLSGVFVNMGLFAVGKGVIFEGMANGHHYAGALAVFLSILTNFLLNDAWTWRDRRSAGPAAFAKRMLKYYIVAGAAGIIQIVVLVVCSDVFGINDYLSNFAGIGAGVLINFFINHLWTFKTDEDTAPRSAQEANAASGSADSEPDTP